MIDKDIRKKLEEKEEITAQELIKYFNYLPAPIEKGLFKKFRQRRAEKTHVETQQYLLDNFDTIMATSSTIQMSKFLTYLPSLSHREDIFKKLSQNNSRLIELFNSQYGDEVSQALYIALSNSREAHIFFEQGFSEFYANTNRYQFDIRNYLVTKPVSDEIEPLIFKGMLESINSGCIRKEDVQFFLKEYLHHVSTQEHVSWDFTGSSVSGVSDITKQQVQEDFSPEVALYLIQNTDQPIFVRQLLRNFGIDSPEIVTYLDTHLDEIVDEISQHSRYSSSIKTIVQKLMDHEGTKPSEIEYASKGGFGRVFKIGDKVLKYGKKAFTAELPYNSELFLQPYFRSSLDGSDFLEVYEQVDVGGNREEMYQLYKGLRDQGLIWTDIKPNNVGHLRKPNAVNFEGTDSMSFKDFGFQEDKKIPVAQPGNVVLIDLDFVFLEGTEFEVPEDRTAMDNFYEFSARYKREKEAEQAKTQTQVQSKKKNNDLDRD